MSTCCPHFDSIASSRWPTGSRPGSARRAPWAAAVVSPGTAAAHAFAVRSAWLDGAYLVCFDGEPWRRVRRRAAVPARAVALGPAFRVDRDAVLRWQTAADRLGL